MSMTEPRPATAAIRWQASIRDREVEVEWRDGEFHGDREVLLRLERLPRSNDVLSLDDARALVGCVVLDPVEIVEIVDPGIG